jgi:DNA mismatch endonuclease (patch repair protein)
VSGILTSPSTQTRRRMEAVRRRDTGPEMALRSALHGRGLRFRVDAPIQGRRRRADLVFTRVRIAVYVDGCFWHRCPLHGTLPKSNTDWWVHKLQANVERDRATDRDLTNAGWLVIRVWEHEDVSEAATRVEEAYLDRRHERNRIVERTKE